MVKTTIIISELTREQTLTVPKFVKSQISQLEKEHHIPSDSVEHWAELPGLSRLVVMLKTEEAATELYEQLKANNEDLKIFLSEHIRPRHNSDPLLEVKSPRSPSPEKYLEPEPTPQAEGHLSPKGKKTLLESLTLDTSNLDDATRQKRLSTGSLTPRSPTITLEQV